MLVGLLPKLPSYTLTMHKKVKTSGPLSPIYRSFSDSRDLATLT